MARFAIASWVDRRSAGTFPWGTLLVNLSGAFLAGCLLGLPGAGLENRLWQFGILGFLGSYTTVSSFSLQALELAREGRMRAFSAQVLVSVAGCLAGAGLGLFLSRLLA